MHTYSSGDELTPDGRLCMGEVQESKGHADRGKELHLVKVLQRRREVATPSAPLCSLDMPLRGPRRGMRSEEAPAMNMARRKWATTDRSSTTPRVNDMYFGHGTRRGSRPAA